MICNLILLLISIYFTTINCCFLRLFLIYKNSSIVSRNLIVIRQNRRKKPNQLEIGNCLNYYMYILYALQHHPQTCQIHYTAINKKNITDSIILRIILTNHIIYLTTLNANVIST